MSKSDLYIIIGVLLTVSIAEGFWIYNLNEVINVQNDSITLLSKHQEELVQDVNSIVNEINNYKSEIDKSMAWFSSNSVLGDSITSQKTKGEIDKRCIEITEDGCKIKTGCFYLVNSKMLGLSYKTDSATSHSKDKLQSIDEFYSHKGGDCEDYSLFYKAETNYALNKCKGKEITIESWQPKAGSSDQYFLDYDNKWYTAEAEPVRLKRGYTHPVVVCGNISDSIKGKVGGHCVIAYTKEEITSVHNVLDSLNKAQLVEPQNGVYLGLINDASSGTYLLTKNNYEGKSAKSIYLVITDHDLYMFDFSRKEWISYAWFSDRLDKELDDLKYWTR